MSSTAAGPATASRRRAASPGRSSRPIPCRSRRSRRSCAAPIAPCRPTWRRFCRTRTSPTSTPTCRRSRSPPTTRASRCSISSRTLYRLHPATMSSSRAADLGLPEIGTLGAHVDCSRHAMGTHRAQTRFSGIWISAFAGMTALQIEHEPLALAASAADHDLGVGGLLLLGEDRVPVLGIAGDDPLLAGPADAELAGIVDIHSGIEQHLQDALALGNDELLSGARKLDHEAALLVRLLLGREIFDVDLLARPVRGGGLERLEHRRRSAAIEVRVLGRLGDDRRDVEELAR